MIVAIIPARGGSKRIAKKNIKRFCGKPIIAYSIERALESKIFDHVIVSTDSEEIAAVARSCGASVPFVRPQELSDDHTTTIPVVRHAIAAIGNITYACCIYPTAPFVRSVDICNGLEQLRSSGSLEFSFPVTTFPFPIWRAIQLTDTNRQVSMFWPENGNKRSQDFPEAYHDAGQFYWGTRTAWERATNIFNANSVALVIPRERVQDIDTVEDWRRAEAMYQVLSTEED